MKELANLDTGANLQEADREYVRRLECERNRVDPDLPLWGVRRG